MHVVLVQQYYAPAIANAAISIVQTIDRGIKLIVTANGHHQKLARFQIMHGQRMNSEYGFAARGLEDPLASGVSKMESARLTHPLIVVFKPGNHTLDQFANAIIVRNQSFPIDSRSWSQSSARQSTNNCRLTQ